MAVDAPDEDLRRGIVGAAIAVTAWGGSSVIAKVMAMGGLAIATYRFTLYAAILVVWMLLRSQPVRLGILRHSMWGGLALGLDVALFFSAVKLTTVVNATVIAALQPALVSGIAARFFGERIQFRDAIWSLAALGGVLVVVLNGSDTSGSSLTGDLFAVGALLAWTGYFVASRQSRLVLTPTEFTLGTAVWSVVVNLPLAILFGQNLSLPSARDIALLILMTVVAGIVGHSLMNWSLVRVPLWLGSTMTLLIPVASAVMAWVVLGEALRWIQVAGIALVIASLAVIVRSQSPTPAVTAVDAPEPTAP